MTGLREAIRTLPEVLGTQSGIVRKVVVGGACVLALAGYCLLLPLFALEKRGWR